MNEDPSAFMSALAAVGAFIIKILNSHFFIGLIGAMVSLRGVPGATWPTRLLNALSGMVISGIGTPGLAEWMQIDSVSQMAVLAFALGLFGLNLVDELRTRTVELIRTTKLSDFFPGKKGD